MKKALLIASVALVLAACTRTEKLTPAAATQAQVQVQVQAQVPAPDDGRSAIPRPLEERVLYLPSADRALASGDNSSDDMHWQALGTPLPALLGEVLYGLVLTDTELSDKDGNPTGNMLPETSRVSVLEASDWQAQGAGFQRSYRVSLKAAGKIVEGWIDSSAVALMLAESGGLAAGVLPRKIVVGGGESEYSLLVIFDGRHVTIVDTSVFPFPDSFHPSGVVSVSLQDVNADSLPEILLEAETIVSLRVPGGDAGALEGMAAAARRCAGPRSSATT